MAFETLNEIRQYISILQDFYDIYFNFFPHVLIDIQQPLLNDFEVAILDIQPLDKGKVALLRFLIDLEG